MCDGRRLDVHALWPVLHDHSLLQQHPVRERSLQIRNLKPSALNLLGACSNGLLTIDQSEAQQRNPTSIEVMLRCPAALLSLLHARSPLNPGMESIAPPRRRQ